MEEMPIGFHPCASCTRTCYKGHGGLSRDQLQPPCFIKALCDSNLAAMATCWMVIPSAWLKLYGDEVGNSAILHGPSGHTWQVGVGRPKWVAFRVGWRTFAADNGLEKGDLLVFTLIGKSEFSVKVFDSKTCLEKESAVTATNTGCYDSRSPVQSDKRKQRDDEENSIPHADTKRISSHRDRRAQMGESEQTLERFRTETTQIHHRRAKSQSVSWPNAPAFQAQPPLLDLNSQPLYLLPCTASEGNRNFLEVQNQLLDVVHARTIQGFASDFVYQPHPISVRSLDVAGDTTAGGQSIAQQECASGGRGPATRFASQRRPVIDSTKERSSEYIGRHSSGASIISEHSAQLLDLNKEQPGEEAGQPILSPAMILERQKAVELGREAVHSTVRPCHLVVLRPFHVHGRAFVRFPVTFGKQHMPRKTVPMHLIDSDGHAWPMVWLRDNETHMGFTRGWREFCLAKELSEGDVCVFELIETTNLTLVVHLFRATEVTENQPLVAPRVKRLELENAKDLVNTFSYGKKRKVSAKGVDPVKKKVKARVRKEILAPNSQKVNPFVRSTKALYEAFHRPTVTRPSRNGSGSIRREFSPAASVGRERLKLLSAWATKEKGSTMKALGSCNEIQSQVRSMEDVKCSKKQEARRSDDIANDVPETTWDETLSQLSTGGIDPETPNNIGDISAGRAPASLNNIGKTKLDNIKMQPWIPLHRSRQEKDRDNEHGRMTGKFFGQRCEPSTEGWKSGINTPRQWAKTRKRKPQRYRLPEKAKKRRTWGWSTLTPSAQKWKIQALRVRARLRNSLVLASRRPPVTDSQRDAAKDAALRLKAENPTTLVIMKKSHVYRKFNLEFPPAFGRILTAGERVNIFLQDEAGEITSAVLSEQRLTSGWQQFSLKYLLEEGDVCVFELTDTTNMTFLVHIFRVVEADTEVKYWDHYRVVTRGHQRIEGGPKELPETKTGEPHLSKKDFENRARPLHLSGATRTMYLAIQKSIGKHRKVKQELEIASPRTVEKMQGASPPSWSPSKKVSTSCASRSPASKLSLEKDIRSRETEERKVNHPTVVSPSCVEHGISETSPMQIVRSEHIPKDVCETTSKKRKKHHIRLDERMVMPLPTDDDDDSENEEGNYYRVIRIIKKRYFKNEKQYLTELDGPVLQTDGRGGLREYDDIKWWVPEKAFSAGFASCYF